MTTEREALTAARRVRKADVRQRTTFGNRFRFLARVLGLTGVLAAAAGWVLAADDLPPVADWSPEALQPLAEGAAGVLSQVGVIALLVGVAAVVLLLVLELLGALFLVTGRKTVVGTNVAVQIALATLLLVIVNALSFRYYERFDLTRNKEFTLQPELVDELKTLRADSPTTIVVLQLHKTAGTLSDKPDALDYAAERKVVEKVRDLVDQLREFGPRFNVVVLDVEEEGYEKALRDLTRTRPGLGAAVQNAPENSIFFYADGKVRSVPRAEADRLDRAAVAPDPADSDRRLVYPGAVTRMSFTDFYQLDKTASKEATPEEREQIAAVMGGPAYAPGIRGKGNLVLIPRGNQAFVRKVLALEERKPRVGLAVIHPVLSTRGESDFNELTATGLRAALEANGFEVVDIILKKWSETGPPTPDAATFEESDLDRVEAQYNDLADSVAGLERAIPRLVEAKAQADKALAAADAAANPDDRVEHLRKAVEAILPFIVGRLQTEDQLRQAVDRIGLLIPRAKQELAEVRRELAELTPRYQELLKDERAVENRRLTDVKAKLKRYTDECDLLIVPRLTVFDITRGQGGVIRPSLYNLSREQAEVVKEFLKAGKPALFAVGPTNVDRGGLGAEPAGDVVERLLPQLGIVPANQTILTDAEVRAMVERRRQEFGVAVEVPPLLFDRAPPDGKDPNPIAAAYRVSARAVDRKLDVREGGFRPIYPIGPATRQPYDPVVMTTGPTSFNKDQPIPEGDAVPKYDPTRPDDPRRGTRDEERRGPFPVGVAVEVPVPVDWLDKETLAPSAVPDAALAGPAAAYPLARPGFAGQIGLAAAVFPFDHGLTAALVTLAARQVERPTVRVAVYGHGGLFTGKDLDPANETLLLHTVNWLLERDDRLPAAVPDEAKWRYPRADLSPREFFVWRWSMFLGLPLLCVYFGLIALMVRKVR